MFRFDDFDSSPIDIESRLNQLNRIGITPLPSLNPSNMTDNELSTDEAVRDRGYIPETIFDRKVRELKQKEVDKFTGLQGFQPSTIVPVDGDSFQSVQDPSVPNIEDFKLVGPDGSPLFFGDNQINQPIDGYIKPIGTDHRGNTVAQILNRDGQPVGSSTPNLDEVIKSSPNPALANDIKTLQQSTRDYLTQSITHALLISGAYGPEHFENSTVLKMVDEIQSGFAHLAFQIGSALDKVTDGKVGNIWDEARRMTGRQDSGFMAELGFTNASDYLRTMANDEVGKQILDWHYGVDPNRTALFQERYEAATQARKDGDWLGYFSNHLLNLDDYIVRTIPHMTAAIAGSALVGAVAVKAPIGAALWAGGTASKAAFGFLVGLPGVTLASLGKLDSQMSEFEENNGRAMTFGEAADALARTNVILALGNIPIGLGIPRVLSPALARALSQTAIKVGLDTPRRQFFGRIGGAIIGEGLQEGAEQISDTLITQDQQNKRSAWNIARDPEVFDAAVIGGMVGGTFGGFGAVTNYRGDRRRETNTQKLLENRRQQDTQLTVYSISPNDRGQSVEIPTYTFAEYGKMRIDDLKGQAVKGFEEVGNKIKEQASKTVDIDKLSELAATVNAPIQAVREVLKKKSDELVNLAKKAFNKDSNPEQAREAAKELKRLGYTKEEVFREYLHWSDPTGERSQKETGRKPDDSTLANLRKQAKKLAEQFGIDSATAEKLINESGMDSQTGEQGYKPLSRNLEIIDDLIKEAETVGKSAKEVYELELAKAGTQIRLGELLNNSQDTITQAASVAGRFARGIYGKVRLFGQDVSPKDLLDPKSPIHDRVRQAHEATKDIHKALSKSLGSSDALSPLRNLIKNLNKYEENMSNLRKRETAETQPQKTPESPEPSKELFLNDSSEEFSDNSLYVFHQITKDNLSDIFEVGAVTRPSLGITSVERGQVNSQYGRFLLIGNQSFLGNETFYGGDIQSSRYSQGIVESNQPKGKTGNLKKGSDVSLVVAALKKLASVQDIKNQRHQLTDSLDQPFFAPSFAPLFEMVPEDSSRQALYEVILNSADDLSSIATNIKKYNLQSSNQPKLEKAIETFIIDQQNHPVFYFEAKSNKSYKLSDFNAILVPRNTDSELIQKLESEGLIVKSVDIFNEQALKKALKELDSDSKEDTPSVTPSVNPRSPNTAEEKTERDKSAVEYAEAHKAKEAHLKDIENATTLSGLRSSVTFHSSMIQSLETIANDKDNPLSERAIEIKRYYQDMLQKARERATQITAKQKAGDIVEDKAVTPIDTSTTPREDYPVKKPKFDLVMEDQAEGETREQNVSDWAVQSVFEGNLATLSITTTDEDGTTTTVPFNLSNLISVSNKPESQFAIGFAESTDGKIEPITVGDRDIDIQTFVDNSVKAVSNITVKLKSEKGLQNALKDSLFMRLLYSSETNADGSVTLTPNPTVTGAIALGALDFMLNTGFRSAVNADTVKELANWFPIHETRATTKELTDARSLIQTHGVPSDVFTDLLGRMILGNLGLKANPKGIDKAHDKLASGLGAFAFVYMERQGWISTRLYDPREQFLEDNELTQEDIDNFNPNADPFDLTSRATDAQVEAYNSIKPVLGFKKGTQFVKTDSITEANFDGKRDIKRKEAKLFLTALKLKKNSDVRPQQPINDKSPFTISDDVTVRNTNNIVKVASFARKILGKLVNTSYEIDVQAARFALEDVNRANLEKAIGILSDTEIELLPNPLRISAKGKNTTLRKQIDDLEELVNTENPTGKWYFNWFFSKNDRYFIDSNHVNPQTNKALQRFLILPSKARRVFDTNNVGHNESMHYAIAQAFDSFLTDEGIEGLGQRISSMSKSDLEQMRTDLFEMSKEGFKEKYSVEGIENIGQALNVLQHLIRHAEAKEKGQTKFETWLAVENDSTTSGYFIRFLQFPHPKTESFWSKVGLISWKDHSENAIAKTSNLKALQEFVDLYKTMADRVDIPDAADFKSIRTLENGQKVSINSSELESVYKTLVAALPKPEPILNEQGKPVLDSNGKPKTRVTPELRKLFKNPVMIFGYTAGKRTISNQLSEDISREFLEIYAKNVEKDLDQITDPKIKAVMKTFEKIEEYYNTNQTIQGKKWRGKFRKSSFEIALFGDGKNYDGRRLDKIWLTLPGEDVEGKAVSIPINLEEYFRALLNPTYGQAVWDSLEGAFKHFTPFNSAMNIAFNTMFKHFEKRFDRAMKVLERRYGKDAIPIAERTKVIESLFNIFPAIRTAYSNDIAEGLVMLDTQRFIDSEQTQEVHSYNPALQENEQSTTYLNVLKFIDAGRAGAVLPIHMMDGAGLSLVLEQMAEHVMPVHDAFVMSALDNGNISNMYNQAMFDTNKVFDVFDTIANRFTDVMKELENLRKQDLQNRELLATLTPEERADLETSIYSTFIEEKGNKWEREGSEAAHEPDRETETTVKQFIDKLVTLNRENQTYRENLRNQHWLVLNMPGTPGAGYFTGTMKPAKWKNNAWYKPLYDTMVEKHKNLSTWFSDPNQNIPLEHLENLQDRALSDVDARLEVFDLLDHLEESVDTQLGVKRTKENAQHKSELKKLIAKVDAGPLKDYVAKYVFGDRTTGSIYYSHDADGEVIGKNIVVMLDSGTAKLDSKTNLNPLSSKSASEVYAHEVIHAGIEFALKHFRELGLTKDIVKLLKLQKHVIEAERDGKPVVSWETFMPTDYDPSLQSVYEGRAKDLYNYIFNNPNIQTLQGLAEFVAHGLTNRKLIEALNSIDSPIEKRSLWQSLKDLANMVLDAIKGTKDFSKAFGEWNQSTNPNNVYESLATLHEKLNTANNKAVETANNPYMAFIDSMFRFLGVAVKKGDEFFSPIVKYVGNIADARDWEMTLPKINDTMFDRAKAYTNMIALAPLSTKRRRALSSYFSYNCGLAQQGLIQTVFREMQTPDADTSALEIRANFIRQLERAARAESDQVRLNILSNFSEKLTEEQEESLTRAFLFTDLRALTTFTGEGLPTNVDEILGYLQDEKKVETRIAELSSYLQKQLSPGQYNYTLIKAEMLGDVMVNGGGYEAGILNAHNIAKGIGSGESNFKHSPAIIKAIDQLASLYALQKTDPNTKAIAGNLTAKEKKGVSNFLLVTNEYFEDTTRYFSKDGEKTNFVSEVHKRKGYTKPLYDHSIDVQILPLKDESKLLLDGYELIKTYDNSNRIMGSSAVGLYRRKWNISRRIDGSVFVLSGAGQMIKTLEQSAKAMAGTDKNIINPDHLREAWFDNANEIATRMNQLAFQGKLTLDMAKKMSAGYSAILSPNGGIYDFKISLNNEDKQTHLKSDLTASSILSKMYGQKVVQLDANNLNSMVIDFLKEAMVKKDPNTDFDIDTRLYIKLEENSPNQYLREVWKIVPKQLLEEIALQDKKGGFYVREDWLLQLFGTHTTSVIDNRIVNNVLDSRYVSVQLKNNIKAATVVAENVMKMFAWMAKQNIVIRLPAVLIGNIFSNINLSTMQGLGTPMTIGQRQLENMRHLKEYMKHTKELRDIELKIRLGTATQTEKNKVNNLKSLQETNPVQPLMDKGMFSAIVEDLNPDEVDSVGKMNKFLNRNLDKLPKSARWIVRQMYMMEGTFFYDFMFQTTQYSDFIARTTHYQLSMERFDKEQKEALRKGKITAKEYRDYKKAELPTGKKNSEGNMVYEPNTSTARQAFEKFDRQLTIDVWNAFVNYDKPQSSKEQYLNDMGLVMFTKFAKRIQHQIFKSFSDHPISSILTLMFLSQAFDNYSLASDNISEQIWWEKNWGALVNSPFTVIENAIIPMPIQMLMGMKKPFGSGIM